MPVFEYSALNARGKSVTGVIDAESALSARQKLRKSGVFPVAVTEDPSAAGPRSAAGVSPFGRYARVRPGDVAMLTRQLSTLIGAGFPLVSAIDALIPQSRTQAMKRMLARLKSDLVEGSSFSKALSRFPGAFSPIYVSMVGAGEASGTLEIVLERLAEDAERQQALVRRIRAALAYPFFMALLGVVVLFLLLVFIVPSITGIFADMNQVLPAPTRFLIAFSEVMSGYWWAMLGLVAGVALAARVVGKTVPGRRFIDRWKLRLPLLRSVTRKTALARVARTLGSLLKNGVPLMRALDIVGAVAGNVVIAKAVKTAAEGVEKGRGLGRALSETRVFPDLYIQMVEVGEQSGQLENMLEKIASAFEGEVEARIMGMTALLEPVMILVMGVAVGFVVLSICLPIFEMNRLVM